MAKKTVEKHEKIYVHIEWKKLLMFLRGIVIFPLFIYLFSSLVKILTLIEKDAKLTGWWTPGIYMILVIFIVGGAILSWIITFNWDDI